MVDNQLRRLAWEWEGVSGNWQLKSGAHTTKENRYWGTTTITKNRIDQERGKRRVRARKRRSKNDGEGGALDQTKKRGEKRGSGGKDRGKGKLREEGEGGTRREWRTARRRGGDLKRNHSPLRGLWYIHALNGGQKKRNIVKRIKSKKYTKYGVRGSESGSDNNNNKPKKEDIDIKRSNQLSGDRQSAKTSRGINTTKWNK